MECKTWNCTATSLPHVEFCHTHLPRFEIPPRDELHCPTCGELGGHGAITADTYYCNNCGEMFDPRRPAGETEPRCNQKWKQKQTA